MKTKNYADVIRQKLAENPKLAQRVAALAEEDATAVLMIKQIREWATDYYGARCQEFDQSCYCCAAWRGVDLLAAGVDQ